MAEQVQTRENHARFHPLFHFVFVPGLVILFGMSFQRILREPGREAAAQLLLTLLVGIAGFLARAYALKAQDRVIRLEERLRLAALLPNALHPKINELSESQLIALRFASDAELPALAQRAWAEQLNAKAIKDRIEKWRPDYFRI